MSVYEFTSQVEPSEWVEYVMIIAVTLFFVTQILRPSWYFFVGLIISLFIVYYRIDKKKRTISSKNKELLSKMKELVPRPENFQMDPDLVNFFYNIREYRLYNTEAYDQCLIAVDLMLKIVSEIEVGVYHCAENIDLAKEQANEALNHLHTIIFKSPIPKAVTVKFQTALNVLQILLRRHIDHIVNICQREYKKRGIDINTKFVYNKGPRPHDNTLRDFDFYN